MAHPQPPLRGSLGLTEGHGGSRRGEVAQRTLYVCGRCLTDDVVVNLGKRSYNQRGEALVICLQAFTISLQVNEACSGS